MSIKLDHIYREIDDFTLDIDLEINPGEMVSLLGPSGCGKSTTLRIIAGFEESDRGSVLINDKSIGHLPPEKRKVGMVFQDYALFPHMNVFENIAYGPKINKWNKDRIEKAVHKFLQIVHLEGFEKREITHLSGGEQQRVALARALITEPQLLLLDEPLSALDAKLRRKLRREIRRIQQELKITTIYVTHDQEEALAISDRIAVMNNGKCIQFDRPEILYRKPSHIFSAGFIGNSNLIKIDKSEREKNLVETEIGRFKVDDFANSSKSETVLFFRPDKCTPVNGTKRDNIIEGIIIDEEYSGTHMSIEVDVKGITIKALLGDNSNWKIGDNISLHIPSNECLILPS